MKNGPSDTAIRAFALQAAVLACIGSAVFWAFYSLDYVVEWLRADGRLPDLVTHYFAFDPAGLSDTVGSLAGVNAAVFGIVITVVSIIVQLSADRYTGVARVFVRDRVNIWVSGYFVVCCVTSVWLAASLQSDSVPRITLAVVLSLTTGGFVIMVPYFGYVFWFLEPRNLINRIHQEAIACAEKGVAATAPGAIASAQAQTLFGLEELTDIANNSISGKDKIIASAAVDALKDFAIEHVKLKSKANAVWLSIGPKLRQNPDFVAMDAESLGDLEERRTWVEWKVMRQYLTIYNEALGSMRDINYVIAIDTRYICEAAAEAGDSALVELACRYMNSYLRSTLNARDVRTAYNVLNQYRKLAETMLSKGHHGAALSMVRHMKYYGLTGRDMDLSFVTETVAYDLSTLAQMAHELKSPSEQAMLAEFLELDRPPYVRGHEKALVGVRKAQVKLAAYYICIGEDARARAIADDMREEPPERLLMVRRQLETVESKDFWEIIDRGRNFEYMPPEQRACLATFFSWLQIEAPAEK